MEVRLELSLSCVFLNECGAVGNAGATGIFGAGAIAGTEIRQKNLAANSIAGTYWSNELLILQSTTVAPSSILCRQHPPTVDASAAFMCFALLFLFCSDRCRRRLLE